MISSVYLFKHEMENREAPPFEAGSWVPTIQTAPSGTQTGWCLKILHSMTSRPNGSSQTVSTSNHDDI